MPTNTPDIAAVSDDDYSVDSSPHVEMSESQGEIWPDHPNLVDNYAHDCDSVNPNVVEPDPDSSPPVCASELDQYNHCYDPFASHQCCLQCQHSKQEQQWSRHDDGQLHIIPTFLPALWIT